MMVIAENQSERSTEIAPEKVRWVNCAPKLYFSCASSSIVDAEMVVPELMFIVTDR